MPLEGFFRLPVLIAFFVPEYGFLRRPDMPIFINSISKLNNLKMKQNTARENTAKARVPQALILNRK